MSEIYHSRAGDPERAGICRYLGRYQAKIRAKLWEWTNLGRKYEYELLEVTDKGVVQENEWKENASLSVGEEMVVRQEVH